MPPFSLPFPTSAPRIVVSDEHDDADLTMLPINITALDDAVSLVHIPLSACPGHAEAHSTRMYWTIDRACEESQEFFNVTSNRLEVAIFASKELIESEWGEVVEGESGVRLSEGWRVFEINSGDAEEDSSENYDSPHLRYVSAPLAKAGITILYQSSYHADFLLVKEADFERASNIFAGHGWTINATSNPSPRLFTSPAASTPGTPSTPRARSSLGGPPTFPTPSIPGSADTSPPLTAHPSGHEITPLPSSLAFVGFHRSSHNFQLHTGLVQKYLTWPGRCRALYTFPAGPQGDRPFISYTRTQDGASLVTEVKVIRGMFRGLEEGMLCGDEMGENAAEESEAEMAFESESEVSSSTDRGSGSETETETSDTDLGEDSVRRGGGGEDVDTPKANGTPRQPKAASPTYFTFPARPRAVASFDPIDPQPTPRRSGSSQRPRNRHRKTQSVPSTPGVFELEAGVELDEPRERVKMHKRRSTVGRGLSGSRERVGVNGVKVGLKEEKKKKGRKICIQLDMSGVGDEDENGVYHLDKSGLVTRFSTLLQQANIRMLYSSTFHTANILVEAKDVKAARRLLAGIK